MKNARTPEQMQPVAGTFGKASLDIFLFGTFRASRNGRTVSISRRKTQALLAYLVVTHQPHTREALIALLWPDEEPGLARSNLRRILSELNTHLGKGVFSIQRDQVGLNPQIELYVDVVDFKHKVLKVRQHQHSSQAGCQECLADLVKAVDLYTGDLLAGFSLPDSRAFDDWQFFETDSLRQLLAECLQNLVNWYSNMGEMERAVEYARRFLALDPLHEPAHRILMRLYALSGHQAAALRQYQDCVQLLRKEVGVKPDQETVALYEAIRLKKIAPVKQQQPEIQPSSAFISEDASVSQKPNNLAHPSAPLVGRKDELARIFDSFGQDKTFRLLTLTGPGGSGKTRLAVEAALLLLEDSASPHWHGIWFISLAPVTTAKGILDKIAQTLNLPIPEGGEQTRYMLLDFLRPKHMVLVLDNFEHLIDAESIGLVTDILATAPEVKILLTSRERLHLHNEQIMQLNGLRTPSESIGIENEEDCIDNEAVQFFKQSAARLIPGFDLNSDDLAAVSQICRLVQGMPLGIELAAAWLPVLSPAEIAAEIEHSLDFLEADWRDLPERQHSLRAVFESSWSLLGEKERQVLIALAVFQGGFTRLSAESTTGVSLKMLLALVNKSWVSQASSGRYSIHELLRQYLSEKLNANPDVHQKLMENYCSYYANFLEQQAVAMRGSKQSQAFDAIAVEYENILVAWKWLVSQKQIHTAVERMLPGLFFFCAARNKSIEFAQLAFQACSDFQNGGLENTYPAVLPILLTARFAISYLRFPNYFDITTPSEDFLAPLSEAWSLAGNPGTLLNLGFWGIELAYFYGHLINLEQGIESLRRLSDHFCKQELPWEEALALYNLGTLLKDGKFDEKIEKQLLAESKPTLSGAFKIFEELGDSLQCGYALRMLGELSNRLYDRQQAIQYWQAAREKLQLGGDRAIAVHMLVQIGEAYIATCEFESGFQYFQLGARELLEMGYINEASIVFSREALFASRYSDLQHARRVREQSVELSYQKNDDFGIAWHCWEMGELWRLEGDLLAARQWYDKAMLLFEKLNNWMGRLFYQRGLGDMALMAGNFSEAQVYFQESLRLAEQIGHDWAIAYALVGLGRAETHLELFDASADHLKRSYQLAKEDLVIDVMLFVLAGLAGLCAATDENEKAVILARLVMKQKKSWNETKSQAASILDDLGFERTDTLMEQDYVCISSTLELDKLVYEIEEQVTSRWRVTCSS